MALAAAEKVNEYSVKADSDHGVGIVESTDAQANKDFFGGSISESYRMKSELVAGCMTEIGMGRYQWALFVVTGFGWITDNL